MTAQKRPPPFLVGGSISRGHQDGAENLCREAWKKKEVAEKQKGSANLRGEKRMRTSNIKGRGEDAVLVLCSQGQRKKSRNKAVLAKEGTGGGRSQPRDGGTTLLKFSKERNVNLWKGSGILQEIPEDTARRLGRSHTGNTENWIKNTRGEGGKREPRGRGGAGGKAKCGPLLFYGHSWDPPTDEGIIGTRGPG